VQAFDVVSIQYPFPATALKVVTVTIDDCHCIPPPDASAKDKLPEPSVFKT
jgi:hypothetical protein